MIDEDKPLSPEEYDNLRQKMIKFIRSLEKILII
jgi:hypothetical protein